MQINVTSEGDVNILTQYKHKKLDILSNIVGCYLLFIKSKCKRLWEVSATKFIPVVAYTSPYINDSTIKVTLM